ncbi:FHA domain-containing protein [Flavivirga amylovorans]|uniref:FHA domain-containing protein n=1 Tax=Flavivirga amylovorans TaxID=870486 RepID=A0ABT8WXA2_9FLAO|nr:FHA domain-containing protein [Flavivirga amylovorans]MDO5986247.1 FHA domain-containing protein [Flavivirga amylovorans]
MEAFFLIHNGKKIKLYPEKEYTIGRKGHDAIVEIDDSSVSRKHGVIEFDGIKTYIKDTESLNGIYINGEKIVPNVLIEISENDKINIGSKSLMIALGGNKALEQPPKVHNQIPENEISKLKEKIKKNKVLSIGRLVSNDIVIDDPTVSRQHAKLSYENNQYFIEDLSSKNKTYLNGNEIKNKTKFGDNDVITISFYSINLIEGLKDLKKEKHSISALSIEKVYSNGKVGLQPLSINIKKSSFIALMGPSGCGKSTLLKCLNGENPASAGEVFIHGLSLNKNFNLIKKKIGYVPQDDIIHKELTVYKTLYYAAKLRLPDDTTDDEINKRITKVIKNLNLEQDEKKNIRDIKVDDLSGGQRKRISIAVELLTEPTILFLDEPTSPLDPETIEGFLKSLKSLTKEGTTIIMVTHKPEDLNYVDEVVFLGVQGHLTYKGAAGRLVSNFNVNNIVEVYSKMSNPLDVVRFYKKPIKNLEQTSIAPPEIKKDKADSFFIQLYWMCIRYFRIKLNDKQNLILLLAQPLIIAGLVCLVFNQFRIGVLFLMTISAIWFGVSNAAKEIVGEINVYKRERMFNLKINAYIISKCLVLSVIALIQTLVFVSIIYYNFQANPVAEFEDIFLKPYISNVLFMFYISFSATLIGLFLSAYFSSTEKVMTVVPITLMPQIMLAGVMTKIDNVLVEILSFTTLGRWGTEGFARIQDKAFETDEASGSILVPVNQVVSDNQIIDGCNCTSVNALTSLDLYNEKLIDDGKLIGSIFNSFQANLLVIACISILAYVLIYYSLKRKDSL